MKSKTLNPIPINNILLNENAYFYKTKDEVKLSDIKQLFSEALEDKGARKKFQTTYRTSLFDGGREVAKYSIQIFEFYSKPSFFKIGEADNWETKFGLLLFLEYKGYVGIIRKNVSGVKKLHEMAISIDYKILARFLVSSNSKFEKIVSNNMNTAENAIQTKTAEAIDLKGVFSRFGASKQILNSLRLDNKGTKHTIALNTSRVNSFKLKNDFNSVLFWMVGMIKLIDGAVLSLPKSPFLDGFATPLKFESEIKRLTPTYILLRFGNLKNEVESEIIERCYYINEKGEEVDVDLIPYIDKYEKLYELEKIDNRTYGKDSLKIKINSHSISFFDSKLGQMVVEYADGERVSLDQYINRGNNFIVNFDKIEYVYSHHKIFKDSKLLGDLDNFYGIFIPKKEINGLKSEKGLNFKAEMSTFERTSLFSFIEENLARESDCLICDDLGVEWGDFIAINRDDIVFYHAKYHEGGLSASNLEEVFGQAQKNFGSLELSEDMIDYRSKRWLKKYKIKGVQTNISRIRKCPAGEDQIKTIKNLANSTSSNANYRRRVFVVINFISKADLQESLKKLKTGETFIGKGVTLQILWFVNSLLCSANELNVEFRIICKP